MVIGMGLFILQKKAEALITIGILRLFKVDFPCLNYFAITIFFVPIISSPTINE